MCDKDFTLSHTLSCPHGAFPIIRHNEVRDLAASLMTDVCHDVQVEPQPHALSGEVMHHRSAVFDDNARVDIRASGFWRCLHHLTFFDVRVFNSFAASNRSTTLATTFRRHEAEKHRAYEERIREVEHGSFTPLVFSSSGGMGKAATTTYKHLAQLPSEKWSSPPKMIALLLYAQYVACPLSFEWQNACLCSLKGLWCHEHHQWKGMQTMYLQCIHGYQWLYV